MTILPYARQNISAEDRAAVEKVLASDWITQGPVIEAFEKRLAEYTGACHAIAVTSGTAALHLGALALGLTAGKTMWTSPNSFVASANCALYSGADVNFVDIEKADGNMSVEGLEQKLIMAEKAGTLPDVVVPVHFAGQPCEMDRIEKLKSRFGFSIMVDASHAIGSRFRSCPLGSSDADLTVLSFHPVKIITTGEGGAVLTNSDDLAQKVRKLRSHGVSRDPDYAEYLDGPWSYVQTELGFNYRITDVQAALGLSQMDRVDEFVDRRLYLSDRYDELLNKLPVAPLLRHEDRQSACHLYVVRLQTPGQRKLVYEELVADEIKPQVHYIPIHSQPFYRDRGFVPGDFPAAEWHYGHSLSLPLYPAMSDQDQDRVVDALAKILAGAD